MFELLSLLTLSAELARFPASTVATREAELCRAHVLRLELVRRYSADDGRLERAIALTREYVHIWELVDQARWEHLGTEWQRQSLARLERALGPWAYRRGRTPPRLEGLDLWPKVMLPAE